MNTVKQKLDHILACAELWENFGVSRIRAITRTVEDIKRQLDDEQEARNEVVLNEMDALARLERT